VTNLEYSLQSIDSGIGRGVEEGERVSAIDTIYRAEVVGAMLRPPELVEARGQMRAGQLDPAEYRAVEDRAVDEALRIQEDAGLEVVTDGEMRRDIFFDFFIKGMSGLSMIPGAVVEFHGHDAEVAMEVQIPFSVTDRVTALACPGVEEFAYSSSRTDRTVKVTLPSPMMMLGMWNEQSRDAYPDPFDLAADAADAVAGWMRQLADAGCCYIQIDAPDLAEIYADETNREYWRRLGVDPERFMEVGPDLVGMLGNLDLPGVTTALHVCKGNGTQSWIAEGGYDEFSREVFRRAGGFDVYHLEYDDERSGGFEPLGNLSDEKIAVLGLVSTKWADLEDPDELRTRIEHAVRFHPKEHLAIAPQCGFAPASETAEQRKVTPQTQVDKMRLIVEVARSVWGMTRWT
jgi:5-methyltetrahydropteroyltriglutamate--homocysteine methyltransferase